LTKLLKPFVSLLGPFTGFPFILLKERKEKQRNRKGTNSSASLPSSQLFLLGGCNLSLNPIRRLRFFVKFLSCATARKFIDPGVRIKTKYAVFEINFEFP
jgi:hypothetical protein